MTVPASTAHAIARGSSAVPRPRLPRSPVVWVLMAGLPAVAVTMLLTALGSPSRAGVWENAHWTLSALTAFGAVAASVTAASGADRRVRSLFAVGFGSYLLGQIVWDAQVARGVYSVPALSDLFYLLLCAPVATAFVATARMHAPRFALAGLVLDAAIVALATAAGIVAVLGHRSPAEPFATTLTVLAYPIGFIALSGGGLVAALSTAARPRLRGAYVLVAGLFGNGVTWVIWNVDAVNGMPAPGALVNYAFSVCILLAGIGAATWRSEPDAADTPERSSHSVLASLPSVAVLVTLALALTAPTYAGRVAPVVQTVAVVTIVLATLRQRLTVRERSRFAERERVALDRERAARQEIEQALEAQRASEARYREMVDVYGRLSEQMTLGVDESELINAAGGALHRLTPSTRGAIHMLNASEDRLVVASSWGPGAPVPRSLAPVDTPTRCLGMRRGSLYAVEDMEDPLQAGCPAHPAQRGSSLCVPLVALGQAIGVIHLERPERDAFDADSRGQAVRVAEQVGLAIANGRLMKRMEALALTDPLTGLHNARFLDPFLERELQGGGRHGRPTGLLMIDLDHFKTFNDTYGHLSGDDALRAFARTIRDVLAPSDTLARYGGEEFVVVVGDADLAGTIATAERIRRATEKLVVELGPGRTARLTTSIGAASSPQHGSDRKGLVRAADEALYRAKEQGRNRVVAAA